MKVSYNWLKWYVHEMPSPEKTAEAIIFHAFEVESVDPVMPDSIRHPGQNTNLDSGSEAGKTPLEYIFDIKTLPDRNHDCLSHHGIAREISAILGIEFKDPSPMYKIPPTVPTDLKIDIKTPNCRRYMGRVIKNVKVGPSPEWVVKHLESIGQRSINNLVDATNITMFDCGQPTHVFDANKLKVEGGKLKVEIRNANAGEKITLLTGEEKKLDDTMTVISDGEGNALAIAGVKGGTYAEVSNDTTEVVLEVANFEPATTRKTAKALNIHTDAVKRFENDLSPELCAFAMTELSALFVEMFPDAEFGEIVDIYPHKQEETTIEVSKGFINKKLGSDFSGDEIENVWKRFKFVYTREGDAFTVTAPALRFDLKIPEDLVEEVGRIMGYEKIVPILPKIDFTPRTNEIYAKISATRAYLLNDGYSEVMNYTFAEKGDVEVLASASDKKFLRTNLSEGLKKSIALNQINAPLLGTNQVKAFEIGTVFKKNGEETHVAFGDKKNVTEMTLDEFANDSRFKIQDSRIGAEKSKIMNHESTPHRFAMWSVYPFIARDIAVWVPEGTESSAVYKVLKENAGELLVTEPRLFDTFTKDGKTSYAFSLVFQSFDRTLTDEEINPIMEAITAKIGENSGWVVR